jgi:hypothetical protein
MEEMNDVREEVLTELYYGGMLVRIEQGKATQWILRTAEEDELPVASEDAEYLVQQGLVEEEDDNTLMISEHGEEIAESLLPDAVHEDAAPATLFGLLEQFIQGLESGDIDEQEITAFKEMLEHFGEGDDAVVSPPGIGFPVFNEEGQTFYLVLPAEPEVFKRMLNRAALAQTLARADEEDFVSLEYHEVVFVVPDTAVVSTTQLQGGDEGFLEEVYVAQVDVKSYLDYLVSTGFSWDAHVRFDPEAFTLELTSSTGGVIDSNAYLYDELSALLDFVTYLQYQLQEETQNVGGNGTGMKA